MSRLSVILPIYNVEHYLERCIRSLEDQDISKDDFEVICINDGSPDNSRGVILRLQKEFENIVLIDQENQGVSSARNHGIDIASGEYILFVDPDDYVGSNSFGSILRNASAIKAQISFCGFTILNLDGTTLKRVIHRVAAKKVYTGIEAYMISRSDRGADPDRTWAVLFEKEFLIENDLRYLPNVPYLEDGEFISRVLCLAKRCIFDTNTIYQRTKRQGSATNSNLFYSKRATNGFLLAAVNLQRFQRMDILTKTQKKFLNQAICKFVILNISSSLKPFTIKRIDETRLTLHKSGLGTLNLESVSREYKRLGFFYNKSVWVLIIYLFILNSIKSLKMRLNKIIRQQLKINP